MNVPEPDDQRATSRAMWERMACGWGRRADRIRDWGMPVSVAMVEALALQPGERVLELAGGPGDTGFMAAELVEPGGTLISSDGAEAMVDVARERAAAAGIDNAEFRVLELEWIDLETATVDAVLCRWGIMLIVDPEAAAQEIRRVLRPGGRAALAVWDRPEHNPWATISSRALIELGHAEPPDPNAPGMFSLADEGQLTALLESAGFVEVAVEPVALERRYETVGQFVEDTLDISPAMQEALRECSEAERDEIVARIDAGTREFVGAEGTVMLPGRSLVAVACA